MPVAVLTILKFCLLAGIFLFLARVLRAVWVEIGAPLDSHAANTSSPAHNLAPATRTSGPNGRNGSRKARKDAASVRLLRVVEPVEHRGTVHLLEDELTIGRAPGCAIVVTDTFASQLHARVFERDGDWFVEDLGSRNGTFVNRTQINGPANLRDGDRLKVGDTVFEIATQSA